MTIDGMKKFHQKEQKHQNFALAVPKEKRNIVFRLEQCCPNSTTIMPATCLSPERATTIAFNDDVSRKRQENGNEASSFLGSICQVSSYIIMLQNRIVHFVHRIREPKRGPRKFREIFQLIM
jgi:hypothetical protein